MLSPQGAAVRVNIGSLQNRLQVCSLRAGVRTFKCSRERSDQSAHCLGKGCPVTPVFARSLNTFITAIDTGLQTLYPSWEKEVRHESILCQVSRQQGNQECQGHHLEEWQGRYSGCVPSVRNQSFQNRQELILSPKTFRFRRLPAQYGYPVQVTGRELRCTRTGSLCMRR